MKNKQLIIEVGQEDINEAFKRLDNDECITTSCMVSVAAQRVLNNPNICSADGELMLGYEVIWDGGNAVANVMENFDSHYNFSRDAIVPVTLVFEKVKK